MKTKGRRESKNIDDARGNGDTLARAVSVIGSRAVHDTKKLYKKVVGSETPKMGKKFVSGMTKKKK